MRTSVCEFLRQMTQTSWCFMSPGNWLSDGAKLRAERDDADSHTFNVFNKKNECVATFTYFEGTPARTLRTKLRGRNWA